MVLQLKLSKPNILILTDTAVLAMDRLLVEDMSKSLGKFIRKEEI